MSYLYIESQDGGRWVKRLFNCDKILFLQHSVKDKINILYVHTGENQGYEYNLDDIVLIETNNEEYAMFLKRNGAKDVQMNRFNGMLAADHD